jgi:hypothetical protein
VNAVIQHNQGFENVTPVLSRIVHSFPEHVDNLDEVMAEENRRRLIHSKDEDHVETDPQQSINVRKVTRWQGGARASVGQELQHGHGFALDHPPGK